MTISDKIVIPSYFHEKEDYRDAQVIKFADNDDNLYMEFAHLCNQFNDEQHTYRVDRYTPNEHIQIVFTPNNHAGIHDTSWLESDLWQLWENGVEVEMR